MSIIQRISNKNVWRIYLLFILFIFFVGIMIRLIIWAKPMDTLATGVIIDDGFYYFKIAQNIVAGRGSTFDGINYTNGYHPLWMLLNILAFSLFNNPFWAIRALLFLEIIFDISAGIVLTYLAYRLLKNKLYCLIVATLWFLNYRIIITMLNGLETALSVFFINLLLLSGFLLINRASIKTIFFFGIVAGFAILSRTDNIILVMLIGLAVLSYFKSIKPLLAPIFIVILITFPWFLWNYLQFGSILQSSAGSITALIRQEMIGQYGQPVPFSAVFKRVGPLLFDTLKRLYLYTTLPFASAQLLAIVWLIVAFGLLIKMRLHRYIFELWQKVTVPSQREILVVMALWPLLFVVVHTVGRWYFRPYYQASIAPSIIFFFSLLLYVLLKSGKLGVIWALLVMPLAIFSAYLYSQTTYFIDKERAVSGLQATRWLNEHAEDCQVIGSFNAGMLGFYYTNGRVINLDGVVNNNAHEAINAGELGSYALQQQICILSDTETIFEDLLHKPAWGAVQPSKQSELLRHRQSDPQRPYHAVYRVTWANK